MTEYFRATGRKIANVLNNHESDISNKKLIQKLWTTCKNQSKIAEVMGVSQQYVSKIIRL